MRKVGRNEPCPCGSGKKYKRCCVNKRFEWVEDEQGNMYRETPIDDPEIPKLMNQYREEFLLEHGREPGPDETIFSDLGHPEHLEAMMVDMMKEAGIDPCYIYAFEKTGRIVTERNQDKLTDAELHEWTEVVNEHDRRVEQGDKPYI